MLFCDSSAVVKLLVRERESAALAAVIGGNHLLISDLAVVEVTRAIRRRDAARSSTLMALVLGEFARVPLTAGVISRAAALHPANLRSLDAIQLASALSIADAGDLTLIAYDDRLLAAAAAAGLPVASPGR